MTPHKITKQVFCLQNTTRTENNVKSTRFLSFYIRCEIHSADFSQNKNKLRGRNETSQKIILNSDENTFFEQKTFVVEI